MNNRKVIQSHLNRFISINDEVDLIQSQQVNKCKILGFRMSLR